jgi:acyl-CoA synthetase (AMP-forming)/AMP-acid ligase II
MGEVGIAAATRRAPEHPAVVLGSTRRTFRELDERSNGLAEALSRSGVEAGGRVAIMLPNCLEFFDVWLAVAKLDAFVVLVNWHLKADEVAWILDDSGARVLVTTPELAAQVGGALDARKVPVTALFSRASISTATVA